MNPIELLRNSKVYKKKNWYGMKSVKYSSKLVMSLTHKFKTLFEDMSQDKKNRILGGVSFFM